jgi:hypothetical protein
MPSNYKANDPYVNEQVDLDDIFITDAWLIDQFVGGTLFQWGRNHYGQLGNGTTTNYSSPIQIGSLTNWKQIDVNDSASGAVKTDGTLWMWGFQYYGQLGNGTTTDVRYSSPIQIGSLTNWKQVSLGVFHTAAVKTDGTLWTWGAGTGNNGQLGVGNLIQYYSPVQVGSLYNWKQVSGSGQHTAAIKTNGTLWTWGQNSYGALGNGTTIDYSSPVQVGSLTNWKQISAATLNSAAIKTDGTLWTWGYNAYGQLGLGESDVVANFSTANISSPLQASGGSTWANTDPDTQILTVSHRAVHSALIKQDGTLWVGGLNSAGQLGNGTTITYNSPIQIGSLTNWKQVAISGRVNQSNIGMTAAIKTDGTLWTWGQNQFGALGNGTRVYYSSPIQIGALTNWKQVACGYIENVYAIKTDGTLWSWGRGTDGCLGNGTTTYYSSPIQVGSLTNWKQVAAGFNMFAAIKTDGTLWTCGYNYNGSLGNGTSSTLSYSSPIQIGSLTNWKQVSCGTYKMAAIKTDGTLWSWGFSGPELGIGIATVSYSSPIQIGSLTNWKQVSFGATHCEAVKTDGTLWGWGGTGGYGQVGNGSVNIYSSPVQIGSLTNWNQVFATERASVAYTNDNKVYWWGQSLGAGPTDYLFSISSPVQVGSLTNWKQVVSSVRYHTAATKTDGTLWTWGYNAYGGLGNGTNIDYSSPIQVGSLTNWKQVSCGYASTAAIETDGTLWIWGYNLHGQLGNGAGTTIHYSSPVQIGLLTNWKQVVSSRFNSAAITFKDIT